MSSVQLVTAYNCNLCPALTGAVLGAREMKLWAPALKRPERDTNGMSSCRRVRKCSAIPSLRQRIPKWEYRNGEIPGEMQWKACVGVPEASLGRQHLRRC